MENKNITITKEDFKVYMEAIPATTIQDASVYLMREMQNKQGSFFDLQIAAMQSLLEAIEKPIVEENLLFTDGIIVKQIYLENGKYKTRYVQKSQITLKDKGE